MSSRFLSVSGPRSRLRAFVAATLICGGAAAQADKDTESATLSKESMDECLAVAVTAAGNRMSVAQLKEACKSLEQERADEQESIADAVEALEQADRDEAQDDSSEGVDSQLLQRRMNMEALNRGNRFLLTPHHRNYLLPASYQSGRNTAPYEEADSPLVDPQSVEVEFQLSVKVLIREAVFGDNGHLYVGYTNHSLWQAYHSDISRPFRETNHQPELILSFTNAWDIFGFRNVLNEVIINHQSNGQSGALSRSWDRIMFNMVFERGPVALSLKPWYRIPESEGDGPDDPRGDDNPDIHRYMGNFELSAAYSRNEQIVALMLRNNMRSNHNRGAVELNWSFPVSSTVRGYVKYFNGYGHSLIDYDHHTNAIGLGITFTDIF